MTPTALILGATSGIARALSRHWASKGYNLLLAARDDQETAAEAADIALRYNVQATALHFDANDFASHESLFNQAVQTHGALDTVLLCHGYMTPQSEAATDLAASRAMIDANYTSAVSILNLAANYFENRKSGKIVAITSVAGDRGRQSNYIYGSTKAALSTYLQGLRHRLATAGVSVTDIRPGFVDTSMTWGLPKVKRAVAPEQVAKDIYNAARKGKAVAYTPWPWRYIMMIIKAVPNFIFHKTKL